jgi:arylsulfatase A-like enzyme
MASSGEHAAAAPMPNTKDRPPAPAQASNVLFIVVDTLRADHLPLWGYGAGKTPHLDAFAKDAIRFEHAFVNASWTRPSFASMLTGRYPASHQTMHKSASLPDTLTTLAEAMRKGGYQTYGLVTNYNVAPFFNFHQGFDQYTYLEPDFVLGAGDMEAKLLFVQALRQGIETYRARRGRVEPGSAYQDATVVNRKLAQFLDGEPQTPFLAFVAYMDPHDPYFPHPYDGTGYARAANQKPAAEDASTMIRLYDGEITFWDGEFGALIADLKRRGLYDDMTIVVTSDHGEEFFDHGGFWHGTTLYDEQLHVPLLLKLPKNQQGGSAVSHWVESIDIMPTLLRLAGLQVPSGVQGKDLMTASEAVFAEEDHEGNELRSLRMRRGDSELKVIESNSDNPRGLQPFELYRLDQDPGEQVDLSKQDAPVLNLAASRLDDHGRRAKIGQVSRSAVDVANNAAAVEKLRALGYAGGEDGEEAE